MNFDDLKNPGLQEKFKACETPEELVALAKEEGLELGDEQLDAMAGGKKGMVRGLPRRRLQHHRARARISRAGRMH